MQRSNRPTRLISTIAATAGLLVGACQTQMNPATPIAVVTEATPACQTAGAWLDPATNTRVPADRMMQSLAQQRIVLLGESHTDFEHHRWQLHTLAGLYSHHPRLVLGFEMFPRSAQPELDAWTAGRYSEEEFLEASRWREVWGYDPDYYLPLFHFARQNRVPMVALNVERELVSRVGRVGWNQVPLDAREGLSDPASASSAYRNRLAEVYSMEQRHRVKQAPPTEHEEQFERGESGDMTDRDAVPDSQGFEHFVEAQLTWDRAMAEALHNAASDNPEALVVGVLGRGHIEYGFGVPHQLTDLGQTGVSILLPVDSETACRELAPGIADAAFVLAAADGQQPAAAKPRLGIALEQAEDGVLVLQVFEGSVAGATGLTAGDIITRAAGFSVEASADLIEIVQRQAPGTWLPLEVRRDNQVQRFIAKFPTRFE